MESLLNAIYEAGLGEALIASFIVGPVIVLGLIAKIYGTKEDSETYRLSDDSYGHHLATRNRTGRKVPLSKFRK